MNAPAGIQSSGELVLRVLNGRLKGAEHRLYTGRFISVGHSFNNDVVVRGRETSGVSLNLHLLDDIATIDVTAGEATLLGRPIAAGESAHLPFFVPFFIGEFSIAIGDAVSERWDDAEALMTSTLPQAHINPNDDATPPTTTRATPVERAVTRLYPIRDWAETHLDWPKVAIVGALILLALTAAVPTYGWLDDQFRGPQHIKAVLAGSGFRNLTVSRDESSDRLVIHGVLKTDAELARLRNYVATALESTIVDVETTESHAAAATEILSAQAIDAQAKPVAAGILLIDGEYLPKNRQAEIVQMLKIDLPAISKIRFRTNDARGINGLQYFFSSSEYGIATVVEGDPSYIMTADGTRWFKGAVVPTGHQIISIDSSRIRFEREGRFDELIL
jgi:type III secretion protein D